MIETEILIAGYGPVGATLAALLGKAGIKTLVVERDREVYRYPRAAHFDHEIMRIWQKLGICEAILPATRHMYEYEFRNAAGDILMRFDQRGVEAPSGWAPSYMFHQPVLEEALRCRVTDFSSVDVQLGTSLASLERNDEHGVTATVVDDRGCESQVRARYLIGADGGGSLVRRLVDGELFDYGFDEPWLVIDTVATDEEGLPAFGVQSCNPKRPTTVMPMSPLRRRWEFMLKPGETAEDMLDDAKIGELLGSWVRPGQVELVRKAVYRFHGLVAKAWRKNSVFIAGDAAHQMPPFMGQGMCSGIRDADNLSWKLIAVLKGEAAESILDTYQEEREPHVRQIIEAAIAMGRVVCVQDEQAAAMRDQGMLPARAARGEQGADPLPSLGGLSRGCITKTPRAGEIFPQATGARMADGREGRLDDLLGDGFWLIARSDTNSEMSPANVRQLVLGKDVVDASGRLEHWLDSAGGQSVLVRPDRYVFGTGLKNDMLHALAERMNTAS